MNKELNKEWEKEFREYFDKTLKPKKPTMGNLDREILVDFIRNLLSQSLTAERQRVKEAVEKMRGAIISSPMRVDMRVIEEKVLEFTNEILDTFLQIINNE